MNKYHAKKYKGFDSKLEAKRYEQLKAMEERGEITELKTQVPFELIPSQRIDGKVVERPCRYIADFTYLQEGKLVVEDAKGMARPEYIIKRKLMLFRLGIQVREYKRTTR